MNRNRKNTRTVGYRNPRTRRRLVEIPGVPTMSTTRTVTTQWCHGGGRKPVVVNRKVGKTEGRTFGEARRKGDSEGCSGVRNLLWHSNTDDGTTSETSTTRSQRVFRTTKTTRGQKLSPHLTVGPTGSVVVTPWSYGRRSWVSGNTKRHQEESVVVPEDTIFQLSRH